MAELGEATGITLQFGRTPARAQQARLSGWETGSEVDNMPECIANLPDAHAAGNAEVLQATQDVCLC